MRAGEQGLRRRKWGGGREGGTEEGRVGERGARGRERGREGGVREGETKKGAQRACLGAVKTDRFCERHTTELTPQERKASSNSAGSCSGPAAPALSCSSASTGPCNP
jgi:hypothetical protein